MLDTISEEIRIVEVVVVGYLESTTFIGFRHAKFYLP